MLQRHRIFTDESSLQKQLLPRHDDPFFPHNITA